VWSCRFFFSLVIRSFPSPLRNAPNILHHHHRPFSNTLMAKLRRDTPDTQCIPLLHRTLRIIASGTLFLTHTLSLPTHPSPSTVVRAHSVTKTRGGAASTCLSILAQFPGVEAMLVASLGNNDEGKMIINQLEQEGVSTRYSKIWEGASVPSAWVLHSGPWRSAQATRHTTLTFTAQTKTIPAR
jgi:pfkB family carbohydrate kinase